MNNEKAIAILERKTTIPGDGYTWEEIEEAIETAINALQKQSTADLVKELSQREGVDRVDAEPYCNTMLKVNGPAVVQRWMGEKRDEQKN